MIRFFNLEIHMSPEAQIAALLLPGILFAAGVMWALGVFAWKGTTDDRNRT